MYGTVVYICYILPGYAHVSDTMHISDTMHYGVGMLSLHYVPTGWYTNFPGC